MLSLTSRTTSHSTTSPRSESTYGGRGDALTRLALGYLQAVETLRTEATHELNLPFIVATDQGPLHYARTLDVPTLIALSERDPEAKGLAATTPQAPPTTTPVERPQKGGFWSKLFG
jgi:hypothetical protein